MELASRAKELFELFDTNQDGYISRSEFVSVVDVLLGEHGTGVSRPYFLEADKNSDNKISYDEFVVMLEEIDWSEQTASS